MMFVLRLLVLCVLLPASLAWADRAPSLVKAWVEIERGKDPAVKVADKAYFDPQGVIEAIASWSSDGHLTYFVRRAEGYVVRMVDIDVEGKPLSPARTIGTIAVTPAGWSFQTPSGDGIAAETMVPISNGLLAVREGVVFVWQPTQPVLQVQLPKKYEAVLVQNGDVLGTRKIAVRPTYDAFLSFTHELALLDIDKSAIVHKTSTNIKDSKGKVDLELVADRLAFFNTTKRSVAITFDRGTSNLNAVDLDTRAVKTLHSRGMGINWMRVDPSPSGVFRVTYWYAFNTYRVPDLDAALEGVADAAAEAPKPPATVEAQKNP